MELNFQLAVICNAGDKVAEVDVRCLSKALTSDGGGGGGGGGVCDLLKQTGDVWAHPGAAVVHRLFVFRVNVRLSREQLGRLPERSTTTKCLAVFSSCYTLSSH